MNIQQRAVNLLYRQHREPSRVAKQNVGVIPARNRLCSILKTSADREEALHSSTHLEELIEPISEMVPSHPHRLNTALQSNGHERVTYSLLYNFISCCPWRRTHSAGAREIENTIKIRFKCIFIS